MRHAAVEIDRVPNFKSHWGVKFRVEFESPLKDEGILLAFMAQQLAKFCEGSCL